MGVFIVKAASKYSSVNPRLLNYIQIFHHSLTKTKVHGYQFVGTQKGLCKRFTWLLISLGFTIILLINFAEITKTYLQYQVDNERVKLEKREVEFPAVTICNTNPVKSSELYLSSSLSSLVQTWNFKGQKGGTSRRKRNVVLNALCTVISNLTTSCFWKGIVPGTASYASSQCVAGGGQLATVQSQVIKDILLLDSIFYDLQYFWIGLNKSSGSFLWNDGSPLSWVDWDSSSSQPTSDSAKACVMYSNTNKWINTHCSEGRNYLCEYKLPASTQHTTEQTTEPSSLGDTTLEVTSSSITQSTTEQITEATSHGDTTLDVTSLSNPRETDSTTSTPVWLIETASNTAADTEENTVNGVQANRGDSTYDLREDFRRESEVLEALANEPPSIQKGLGYRLHELLPECEFKGSRCNYSDFSYLFDANYGNCYVFNSGWSTGNSSVVRHYTAHTGPKLGLSMILNIEQSQYIGEVSKAAGAVVVVHSQGRMPFPKDEGTLVLPGHKTSIGMKKVVTSRLGHQYKNCKEHIDSAAVDVYTEYLPVNYSLASCYKTCYQKYVITTCGCADAEYPMYGTVFGHFTGQACGIRNRTQESCMNTVSTNYATGKLKCDCPTPCQEENYKLLSSKSLWPAENDKMSTLEKLNLVTKAGQNRNDYIQKNLVKVEIYFQDLDTLLNQQVPAYTSEKYIADIGSILVLWLGCSILTFCELIELLLDVLFITAYKKLALNDSRTATQHQQDDYRDQLCDKERYSIDVDPSYEISDRALTYNRLIVNEAGFDYDSVNESNRNQTIVNSEPSDSSLHRPLSVNSDIYLMYKRNSVAPLKLELFQTPRKRKATLPGATNLDNFSEFKHIGPLVDSQIYLNSP